MNNVNRKKWIFGLAAACCAAACAGLFYRSSTISLDAEAAEWQSVALQSEYAYGEQLAVPSRTVTVNDKEATAVSTLTFPDGTSTLKTNVTLDMAGEYTIAYTALLNGKVYKEEESFSVYDQVYHVGSQSQAAYGRHEKSEKTDGVMVSLAQGDSLQFTQYIDVSQATQDQPLVEVFVTPEISGVLEFSKLEFTFTDSEDSSCYLKVTARQSSEGISRATTYFLAGGNGQQLKGYEEYWNRLHVENEWGTQTAHSFYGYYGGVTKYLDSTKISIRFDAATNRVYTNDSMIVDLDDPSYFTTLWTGFPSGKVRLTIKADFYENTMANFVVSKVKGIDLSQERFTDREAPEIDIDTDYEIAPYACVGGKYPVPSATAKDEYSGQVNVSVQVWYEYTSENALTVAVKDGWFDTPRVGRYSIVYRAQDRMKNIAEKVITVQCKERVDEIVLTLASDLVTEATIGELTTIPEVTVSGGVGNISVKYTAVCGDTEIQIEKGQLRPTTLQDYRIIITAVDHIGQTAQAGYTIRVKKAESPIFTEEPDLPKYLLSGSDYTVPQLYAQDYTSGTLKEILASVTVKDANGTTSLAAGGVYTPVVRKSGDMATFVFTAGGATLERAIPVIRPFEAESGRMKLCLKNYLVSDDATYEATADGIVVTAHSAETSFEFANKLIADGLSVTLNAIPLDSNFSGLKITLEDSRNAACAISFQIINSGKKGYLQTEELIELDSAFDRAAAAQTFEIGYSNGVVSVGARTSKVTKCTDGSVFSGFESGYIYLSIAFVEASEGAAFSISNINDQPISEVSADRIRPRIILFGEYGDGAAVGDLIALPTAIAGDVLDPNVSFTLTVTDPNGELVRAEDGTLLDGVSPLVQYSFRAQLYGSYQVAYEAADTFNAKVQRLSYIILVEDRVAPEIVFQGEFAETIEVGELIIIPEYTATDNCGEATVEIYILTADGKLVYLSDGSNSYRVKYAGVYQVRIIVTDETGNITMVRKTVTVTE